MKRGNRLIVLHSVDMYEKKSKNLKNLKEKETFGTFNAALQCLLRTLIIFFHLEFHYLEYFSSPCTYLLVFCNTDTSTL